MDAPEVDEPELEELLGVEVTVAVDVLVVPLELDVEPDVAPEVAFELAFWSTLFTRSSNSF